MWLLDCTVPPLGGSGLGKSLAHTPGFKKECQVRNWEVGVYSTWWPLAVLSSSFTAESLKAVRMAQSVTCLPHKDLSSDP